MMLASLVLVSIPLTAQLPGRLLEATLVSIGDGDTLQVKAPGIRQLIAPNSIDSANHLIANRAPGTKSRHSNLDLCIRMPDQWLAKQLQFKQTDCPG